MATSHWYSFWTDPRGSNRRAEAEEVAESDQSRERIRRLQDTISSTNSITHSDSTTGKGSRTAAQGQERDEVIFDLLDIHPMTIDQIVRQGLFPTKKNAARRMLRHVRQKKVKQCGTVLLHNKGRPENVYCRWNPKLDNLRHEVILTEFLLAYKHAQVVRGYEIQNDLYPDAVMTLSGQEYLVELDTGSMNYKDIMRKRNKKYETFEGIVLWVALTEARKEGLRRRAESVKHNALFTTLLEHLQNPHGSIWTDYEGQKTNVE